MSVDQDASTRFRSSRFYTVTMIGIAILGLFIGVIRFSDHARTMSLTDFHVFYAASGLIKEGVFSDAYHFLKMHAAEQALGGKESFLPWSYPPQFGLIVAPFAYVPLPLAYFLFTASTLLLFVSALRRLAGSSSTALILMVFPSVALNVTTGQNGLLTGALIALFCSAWLQRSMRAGLPLGLMIIKPHLAVGVGLYVVLRGAWRVAAVAVCTILVTTILATVCFGPQIWPAFVNGVKEVQIFLETGLYPFFRMSSLYGALCSFGFTSHAAMLAQLCSISIGLALVLFAVMKTLSERTRLGVAVLSSLFFSPYLYDYDLTLLAVSLALLAPAINKHASTKEFAMITCLSIVSTGAGMASSIALVLQYPQGFYGNDPEATIGALAMISLLGTILWTIRKELAATRATRPGKTRFFTEADYECPGLSPVRDRP